MASEINQTDPKFTDKISLDLSIVLTITQIQVPAKYRVLGFPDVTCPLLFRNSLKILI